MGTDGLTLNRQVVGSIPTASTNSNPIPSVRYRLRPACSICVIFENLTKLFSLVTLIDDFSQRFQLLVLVRLHRKEVNMAHGLGDGERVAALLHRVCSIGVPSGIGHQLPIQSSSISCSMKPFAMVVKCPDFGREDGKIQPSFRSPHHCRSMDFVRSLIATKRRSYSVLPSGIQMRLASQ
jgi:hypothetical protein